MSSEGELYVSEVIRDAVEGFLDTKFGKDKWFLDYSGWSGYVNVADLPDKMEIKIVDDNDKELGILEVWNTFSPETDGHYSRYVDAFPTRWRIKGEDKGKDWWNATEEEIGDELYRELDTMCKSDLLDVVIDLIPKDVQREFVIDWHENDEE